MKESIGQILAFAVAASLSPIPIIGVVLMLTSPRGRVNGPAFLVGWVAGLTVVGVITLLVGSSANADAAGSADSVSWVKIGLGVLLLVVAVRQWRGRPRGDEAPKMPGWMASVDRVTPTRAVGLGVALSAVNPKNLLLVVGAGLAIAQTGASTADQAVALAVFVVVATLGPALPVAMSLALGERADRRLSDLKAWMTQSNAVIMAVLCLVIGAKLIGDGLAG